MVHSFVRAGLTVGAVGGPVLCDIASTHSDPVTHAVPFRYCGTLSESGYQPLCDSSSIYRCDGVVLCRVTVAFNEYTHVRLPGFTNHIDVPTSDIRLHSDSGELVATNPLTLPVFTQPLVFVRCLLQDTRCPQVNVLLPAAHTSALQTICVPSSACIRLGVEGPGSSTQVEGGEWRAGYVHGLLTARLPAGGYVHEVELPTVPPTFITVGVIDLATAIRVGDTWHTANVAVLAAATPALAVTRQIPQRRIQLHKRERTV